MLELKTEDDFLRLGEGCIIQFGTRNYFNGDGEYDSDEDFPDKPFNAIIKEELIDYGICEAGDGLGPYNARQFEICNFSGITQYIGRVKIDPRCSIIIEFEYYYDCTFSYAFSYDGYDLTTHMFDSLRILPNEPWTPDGHQCYPEKIRKSIKELAMIGLRRLNIPRDILYVIFSFLTCVNFILSQRKKYKKWKENEIK